MNQSDDYIDKINHIYTELDYLSTKLKGFTHDQFISDETLKRPPIFHYENYLNFQVKTNLSLLGFFLQNRTELI